MGSKACVLVVGGAGYIGSHACKQLHRRGHDVVVLDNLIYGHREFANWGEFVLGDIADPLQLRLVFKNHPITAVMHFAAFAYVGESVTDPHKYYVNNVAHTLNLMQAMREAGVDKLIFSSTCATYGIPRVIPIPEEHPQTPINPYGRSKLMVEQVMADYAQAYGLKYVSLRYFNAAGADSEAEVGEWHDPETHLIPLVLDAAMDPAKHIKVFGTDYDTPDGTCIRDYIHVTDLADAHILALESLLAGEPGGAFNLGNGLGHSVREVIEAAERVTGKSIRVVESERRAGDPPRLVGSSERIRKALGWEPGNADIETILATAWKWHQRKAELLSGQ